MNSRQRLLAALNHQQPDRPPRDLGSTTSTGIHPTAYQGLKHYLGLTPAFEYLSARAQLARVEDTILDRYAIDCLPIIPAEAGVPPSLDEHRAYRDRWGVERRLPEGGGHYYVSRPPLAAAASERDIASYQWPEPNVDYRELQQQAQHLRATSDKALILNLEVGFLHQSQFMRGFDLWLMDLVSDAPLAAYLMDSVLEIWLAEARAMIAAVGDEVDVVMYADDIAFQNGPMVSPATYQSLLRPRQEKVFRLLKDSGLKVLYHSCGNILSLIPHLVDMGVDALNPVQVSARGMDDTGALKSQWGDYLTFWGGIDTQSVMPTGTPQQVSQEVRRRLDDLAVEGGYVLATVHDIQPEVPPENIEALFESADQWAGRPE